MSAVWRWRTSGLPTWQGRPSGAFMPLITKTAETWQSFKSLVTGQPGTHPIPAPNESIPRDRLAVGEGQAYARDFGGAWYPQLWYQPGLSQWFAGRDASTGTAMFAAGVQVHSDNQLPVPAIEPQRGTHRLGGGQVVPVFQDPMRRQPVTRKVSRRHA